MTHEELKAGVAGLCDQLGLLWHYCTDSRRCHGPRGFPDLIIASPNYVMFVELKTGDDDTSADQDLWLWTLNRARQLWAVWRPEDLEDGIIRVMLEGLI